ncbi:MAG: dethiobiotin synthase [Akkermansia sp.]|nr:dethiobiotin synthase [Akkermansia sp.]
MNAYFVTGTDVGVGKTHVVYALLRDLTARGVRAMGCKPVSCGDRKELRSMREAAGQPTLALDSINPLYLRTAADPRMGAEFERQSVSISALAGQVQALAAEYDTLLVEGVGGWETPLCPGKTMADLAEQLQLPVLLVVSNRQGAANLAILTVRAIQARGLRCCGIILNQQSEEWDTAAVTNRALIEEFTGIPVLAELIQGEDSLDAGILPA